MGLTASPLMFPRPTLIMRHQSLSHDSVISDTLKQTHPGARPRSSAPPLCSVWGSRGEELLVPCAPPPPRALRLTMLLWWALVMSSIRPTRSVVDTPWVRLHSLRETSKG